MRVQYRIIGLLALLSCFIFSQNASAQVLTVNANNNAAQLVNTLIGAGIAVSNITMNCPNGASGTFNGANSNIGLNSGVLLTSGQVTNAPGPNNQGGAGTDNNAPGDPQLNVITAPNLTFDACVLEFDIVAICDTIQIAYVFASEEYDEFVCATFNDVFAFFISGPNIVGTQNIALVPGTATPVAINTVNNGTVGAFGTNGPGCILSNSAYYVSNANGTSVQYDGFTTNLVAKSAVVPCSTYHIKLAIADAGDGILDSGVFLEEGGIRCSSPFITVDAAVNSPTAQNAVEGCVDGIFTFSRVGDTIQPTTIFYTVAGTATPGVDYPALSGQVNFPANVANVPVVVSAFADGLPEGAESIMIILQDTICNTIVADTAIIFIEDPPTVEAGPNQTICQGDTIPIGAPPTPFTSYLWTPNTGISDDTLANPTVTSNVVGTTQYFVTLTDTNNCTAVDSMTLTVVPQPTSTFTAPIDICVGNNGTITYTGSASGSAIYNWTFGGGTIISGTGAGPYQIQWNNAGATIVTLQVTDGNCVSAIDTIPVNVTPSPVLNITTNDVTCFGFADGDVTANITSGTPNFSYTWSNGATTQTVAGLPIGTYSVTVTDSIGCVDSGQVTLTQPTQVTNNFVTIEIECFGAQSGQITANPAGGTGNYQYLWSNGAVTQTISALGAGTYTVTITDMTNGQQACELIDMYTLVEPPELLIVAGTMIASCGQNNGTAIVNASGGTPPYVYNWSNGGTTPNLTGLAPGPYSITVTDDNGCQKIENVVVGETPSPTVTAGADVSFCEGEGGAVISASASGGTPGYWYTWNCASGPCGLSSINSANPNANPTQSQWYYVQVTDTNGCTSNIDSVFVEVIPKPIVNAGPDIYLCGDAAPCQVIQPTITNSPGPFSYLWIPGTGLNDSTILNPCARPDTTTIYTLVVTDLSTGCTSDFSTTDTLSSVTVHVNPIPIAEAGPDKHICDGGFVQLQGYGTGAGPNYTFEWSPATGLSSTTISNPIASPSLTTEYILTAWSNNCPSYGDTVTVFVHTNPTVDAGPDVEMCLGDSVLIDAQAGGDSTATYTFLWNPAAYLNNDSLEDPMAGPDTTTMFYVQATSNYGCMSSFDSVLVTVLPTPIADAGDPQTICLGNATQLQGGYAFTTTPQVSHADIFVSWYPNINMNDSTLLQPTVDPQQSMWYYITVRTGDCSTTDSVFVTVIPEIGLSVSADTTTTCGGDSVQLTAVAGIGGASFTWMPPDGLANPNSPVTMAAPVTTTTYQVIASEGGCADTADITINVIPSPVASYLSSFADGCVPHTVSFTQNTSDAIFYIWDFGDGSPVSNEEQPTHVYTQPGSYTVTLTAVNAGGCAASVSTLQVNVGEPPIAAFHSDPDFPVEMSLPNTAVNFFNDSEGAVKYTWEFGDGSSSTEIHPAHTYTAAGEYMVTLTVSNSLGCVSEVMHGPYIVLTPELFIPNVFSPNDDDINDVFMVRYTGSQPFNLQIFDRWGNQIFETKDKYEGWRGVTVDGNAVSDGVYYYLVRVGDKEYAGDLSLVR